MVGQERKYLNFTIYFLSSSANQTHSKKVLLPIFFPKFSIFPILPPNKQTQVMKECNSMPLYKKLLKLQRKKKKKKKKASRTQNQESLHLILKIKDDIQIQWREIENGGSLPTSWPLSLNLGTIFWFWQKVKIFKTELSHLVFWVHSNFGLYFFI